MPANLLERTEELLRGPVEPTHEEISKLAYALWIERGGGAGSAEQDWLKAEQQLRELWQEPHIRTQAA